MSTSKYIVRFIYGLFRAGFYGTIGMVFANSATRDLKSLTGEVTRHINNALGFFKRLISGVAKCSPLEAEQQAA